MPYDYAALRPGVFTEDGQAMFLSVRDKAKELIHAAGCATMERIISKQTGEVWSMMACVDRLVELGELIELPNGVSRAGQHRLFTTPTFGK